MVEKQIRARGVENPRVLEAMRTVPRHRFVPEPFRGDAYTDRALPIGGRQTISQPYVVAVMTEALDPQPRDRVLEVGTGSGYQAAVLSRLCRRVYTVERYKVLLRQAEERFAELRLHNITTRIGDGSKGWREQAPFERIIVTAAAPEVPGELADQLADGGIMVIPVGRRGGVQTLLRLARSNGSLMEEVLSEVKFVPLLKGIPGEGASSPSTQAAGPAVDGLA